MLLLDPVVWRTWSRTAGAGSSSPSCRGSGRGGPPSPGSCQTTTHLIILRYKKIMWGGAKCENTKSVQAEETYINDDI